MSRVDVETILKQVGQLLATAGTLPAEAELAVEKLLNVVESLCSYRQALAKEVERLRQELEKKKKAKTTNQPAPDDDKDNQADSNHSSEKRRKRDKKKRPKRDRRSFKDLKIHEEIECPVDPATLPPDAVRVEDEAKIVQDIEIKPRNIRFQRHVYYTRSCLRSCHVMRSCWNRFSIGIGTTIIPCSDIAQVRVPNKRPRCDWNSMNCFRRARVMLR